LATPFAIATQLWSLPTLKSTAVVAVVAPVIPLMSVGRGFPRPQHFTAPFFMRAQAFRTPTSTLTAVAAFVKPSILDTFTGIEL